MKPADIQTLTHYNPVAKIGSLSYYKHLYLYVDDLWSKLIDFKS